MANKLTTSQLVVKPFQYIEETTEGTVPGSGSTSTIGLNTTISVKKDGQWIEIAQLGTEDLASLNQGAQKFDLQIKYFLINSTFLQVAVKSANYTTPTGTVSKSLSLVWSQYFNGTENYIVVKGARIKSTTIDVEIGKPHTVTVDLVAMNVVAPSSSAPAGLTLVTTAPTGTAWDWLAGGASPVTYNSTALDAKKFSCTISRNTKEEWTLGTATPFGTMPHGRRISFNITNLWNSSGGLETEFTTPTAGGLTCAIVLKTSTSTLTLSNCNLTNYTRDLDASSDDITMEAVTGKCLTATVT